MMRKTKIRKATAVFFLCLMLTDIILPVQVRALTTGPSQPEAKQFMEAGTSDVVDLFTGDFKYNIPLLDIDGYPVNLNYQGSVGMDDEASWVGLGWNLNVGAVNRQLRGLPDDMSGDEVLTEHSVKPKITVGGRVTGRVELKGTDMAKVSGSLSLGIFSDNYTGVGAEIGGNAGITLGATAGGVGTSSLGLSAGLGFNSSTQSGVDLNPSISLAWKQSTTEVSAATASISMNLGYNTRQGLKNLSLGTSFGIQDEKGKGKASRTEELGTSTYNYNTPAIYPRIQVPYRTVSRTFSGDFGGTAFTVFAGGGFTGYKTVREVLRRNNVNPSYGFLYAERGKQVRSAMMDFLREKDNVIIPSMPNLPVPIATPDMFSYSGQAGSGQFRLYRGSSGIYFDAESKDQSDNQTLGGDVGIGAYVHGGVSFYKQNINTVTGKWENNNVYKDKGDFEDLAATNPMEEAAYFKQVGEKNAEDAGFTNAIKQERPVWVDVNGKTASANYAYIDDQLVRKSDVITAAKVKKTGRQGRRSPIAYMTASEAAKGGLDKVIKDYGVITAGSFTPPSCSPTASSYSRSGSHRKGHHLSELTVTGDDGKRMVYGLPVYNLAQEEYTFTADPTQVAADAAEISGKNQITYKLGDKRTDQYYRKETQPAYATSYLLTGVLSPDYVDRTGDGITDDDLGTAIKFNYGKLASNYKWRSPYDANKAFYNKGLYADPTDDKGSIVYGEKEIWYLHSIETKTKIVYFLTENRDDALGVNNNMGGKNTSVRQRRLKEIRIYSKSDLTKPIKAVVFKYSYRLCNGVPNTVTTGGKLTLDTLYFQYGASAKGARHPYVFDYNNTQGYAYLSSDRWGTLKPTTNNATDGFSAYRNDEFPYATRNAAAANSNAGMWLLNKITLPSGGIMQVEYESDDYAYVQDKKAMEMVKVEGFYKGLPTPTGGSTLKDAEWIRLKLSKKPSSTLNLAGWFRREYLDFSKSLYVKMFVNVTDAPSVTSPSYFDFVSAYVNVEEAYMASASDDYIYIRLTPVDGYNPLLVAAWQKMKLEYPMYAYPGYKNRVIDDKPVEAILSAVVNSFRTLGELRENFYQRAYRLGYASTVNLDKSFARIVKMDGKRLGGGSRVKKIRISDQWAAMTSATINQTATYGQEYTYRTTWNGQEISSGVASYEPAIGGDENPVHQPISYTEDIKGALNNYLYLEEPFGESLFPAPVVGYSQVMVRDLDESGNADPEKMTGHTVHEFYTARDYPVITKHSAIETRNRRPNGFSNFVGAYQLHELAMTQGYTVILNDMHGKPKADRIYNKSGAEISSVVYHYLDENTDMGRKKLTNLVYTVNEKGEVSAQKEVIGREMELFTDMREEEMSNDGESIHIGLDVIPFFFGIPLPVPHWPTRSNDEYRLFRSAAVTKLAHYYGILDKIVKTENGSTVTTQNLVYDRFTGEAVVSSTTNEFDDPVYNLQLPAYWAYRQMGGAYQNINTILKGFTTNASGVINTQFVPYLSPGDELINVGSSGDQQRYWVINSPVGTGTVKAYRLIDRYGAVAPLTSQDLKIVRSGYRNQVTTATSSIVSLDNPVRNNTLRLENAEMNWLRVLDAKTVLFDEVWSMPDDCDCPPGSVFQDGKCYILPEETTGQCFTFCKGSQTAVYAAKGAYIYANTTPLSPQSITSAYWGNGSACAGTGGGLMMKASKSDSSSTTVTKILNGDIGIASLPGPCVRSDYTMPVTTCGRLLACGIWPCTYMPPNFGTEHVLPMNQWVGFETCINVPVEGTYYIGIGGDNKVKASIATFNVSTPDLPGPGNFERWHLYRIHLSPGPTKLTVSALNSGTEAIFGLEIYYGDEEDMLNSAPQAVIFSTKDIAGQPVQAFIEDAQGSNQYVYRYTCSNSGASVNVCPVPNCGIVGVNPYLAGYLGNWRVWQEKSYLQPRVDNDVLNASTKGARLRNSGHYKLAPYWYYNTSQQRWDTATNTAAVENWVTGRYVLLYNKSGQEVENRDALGRYSSALYGFEELLPTAVASNAQHREIFYDGFEDYKFRDKCGAEAPCDKYGFDIKRAIGSSYTSMMDATDAHSGNYSLKLSSPVTLRTTFHDRTHKSGGGITEYLTNTDNGQYQRLTTAGLYNNGFAPRTAGKYIFSCWVNDGQPASASPGITLKVGVSSIPLTRKAIVEKWKLVEGEIDLSILEVGMTPTWTITGSSTIKIDDIRIFPYDAHIKSYAYDESTLRLMAEMDENNFSTFYEYDEEGSLIRVKKETERGIMTLKETRSAYRKQ